MDIKEIASEAETIVQKAAPYEPFIAGILQSVPGVGIPIAAVQPFMPGLMALTIRGLDDIAKGNGGDLAGAVLEWMQHNMKGQPNSPILSTVTGTPPTLGG